MINVIVFLGVTIFTVCVILLPKIMNVGKIRSRSRSGRIWRRRRRSVSVTQSIFLLVMFTSFGIVASYAGSWLLPIIYWNGVETLDRIFDLLGIP